MRPCTGPPDDGRAVKIERAEKDGENMMIPRFADEPGFVRVDATWGKIQPLELAPGVRTVAEPELIEHLEAGRPVVDTRRDEHRQQARIPGTLGIPHEQIVERIDELDREQVTVLMCNGPQCGATPHAVRELLEHGYPAEKLRYYRGGLHDWMTLGLPIEGARAEEAGGAA